MKNVKEIMLNDEKAIEQMDSSIQLSRGIIGLCVAIIIVIGIFSINQSITISALKSKNDTLEVAKKALEANLLMPQMIKETNLKTE